MKIILNLAGLLVSTFIVWTFKNTPWAATTFLGYIVALVLEWILTKRFDATVKSISRPGWLHPARAERPGATAARYRPPARHPVQARPAQRPVDIKVEYSGKVAGGILGVVIFGMALMLLADLSLGLKWFDFETAGQPAWLGVLKWAATGLSIVIAFLTPILIAFYCGDALSSHWSHRFTGPNGGEGWHFFGNVCGWLLGTATYSHLAFATVFFGSLAH